MNFDVASMSREGTEAVEHWFFFFVCVSRRGAMRQCPEGLDTLK